MSAAQIRATRSTPIRVTPALRVISTRHIDTWVLLTTRAPMVRRDAQQGDALRQLSRYGSAICRRSQAYRPGTWWPGPAPILRTYRRTLGLLLRRGGMSSADLCVATQMTSRGMRHHMRRLSDAMLVDGDCGRWRVTALGADLIRDGSDTRPQPRVIGADAHDILDSLSRRRHGPGMTAADISQDCGLPGDGRRRDRALATLLDRGLAERVSEGDLVVYYATEAGTVLLRHLADAGISPGPGRTP